MGSMNRAEPEAEERGPSKSARKREASALQELGVRLAALPEQELSELALPESLEAALRELNRLPSHGAQLRQRQYIGKLMRKIDTEPILSKLADRKRRHDADVRLFQEIERWRDRLLAEPRVAVEDLMLSHPQADRAALLALLADAARRRELFAFLRRLLTAALVD